MAVIDQFSLLVLTVVQESITLLSNRVQHRLTSRTPSAWRYENGPLDWRSIYFPAPDPGGVKPLRAAIWAPRGLPGQTVFFPDAADGWTILVERLSAGGM